MAKYFPDIELREKCGVFGAFGVDDAAVAGYAALMNLQHRGQEGAGLATYDGAGFHWSGNGGLVAELFPPQELQRLPGNQVIGHTRYGTSGGSGGAHVQPVHIKDAGLMFAENGNQCDISPLTGYLKKHGVRHDGLNDSELKAWVLGHMVQQGLPVADAIEKAYPLFTGAFSSVVMDKESLIAFRDRCGIRPLSIGRTAGGGYMVASETCALVAAGGKFVRDVEPGEMVIINKNGITSRQLAKANPKLDITELVYFARPASRMLDKSIYTIRYNFGRQLATEHPADADIVVPIPNSGTPAAIGFAAASGIPYDPAIEKNPYVHRTFILPTQELRDAARGMKLSVIADRVAGKRVVLVDDSIFRGTTTRGIAQLLREAGATEIHLRIQSPPVKYPDFYGIDIPSQKHLVAAHHSVEEIREMLGVDSLGYLSLDGMVKATGEPNSRFCLAIFNGEYPLSIGDRAKKLVKV